MLIRSHILLFFITVIERERAREKERERERESETEKDRELQLFCERETKRE